VSVRVTGDGTGVGVGEGVGVGFALGEAEADADGLAVAAAVAEALGDAVPAGAADEQATTSSDRATRPASGRWMDIGHSPLRGGGDPGPARTPGGRAVTG
jgi:hypothetical protein